jgi:hypothetical protein
MMDDDAYDDLDELPARPRQVIPAADRELLELAARALGAVRVEHVEGEEWLNLHFADGIVMHGWNPLLFYADTFELQVRLALRVFGSHVGGNVNDDLFVDAVDCNGDSVAATARAVVRAAAEIGKAMPIA